MNRKRSVTNCDCEKDEITNNVWKQITTLPGIIRGLLIGKARYLLRKVKETIHFLRNHKSF